MSIWEGSIEKGADSHHDKSEDGEPEPRAYIEAKAIKESQAEAHRTLNDQPRDSRAPSPGDRFGREFAKKAGDARSQDVERRQQRKNQERGHGT